MGDMDIGLRKVEMEKQAHGRHDCCRNKKGGKAKFLKYHLADDRSNGQPHKGCDSEHTYPFIESSLGDNVGDISEYGRKRDCRSYAV